MGINKDAIITNKIEVPTSVLRFALSLAANCLAFRIIGDTKNHVLNPIAIEFI